MNLGSSATWIAPVTLGSVASAIRNAIGIETHRDVEEKAGGDRGSGRRDMTRTKRHDPRRRVDGELRPQVRFCFSNRHADAPGHRLRDRTPVRGVKRAVGFAELKRRRDAIAGSDNLISRRDCYAWCGGGMVEPVAPAKPVEAPAPLLEKRDTLRQRLESLHAVTGVVAPACMRPAWITLL